MSDSIDTVKLNEVDSELEEAGVKKLSKDEVIKEFPSIKDDIEKKGLNANNITTDTVRASIALPTNPNVNWSTYRDFSQLLLLFMGFSLLYCSVYETME